MVFSIHEQQRVGREGLLLVSIESEIHASARPEQCEEDITQFMVVDTIEAKKI